MIAAGWSPSVRLFEAAVCAIPIISDRWEGLGSLFQPGLEIILADRADDIVEQLTSDADARAIGRAARKKILATRPLTALRNWSAQSNKPPQPSPAARPGRSMQ